MDCRRGATVLGVAVMSCGRSPSSPIRFLGVASVLGLVCLIVAGCGKPASRAAVAREKADAKVRLVVLVVFDQLRGDYLERWSEWFGEGGFRRLEQEGAWFQNCHYPYAVTKTAPGHASLLTGCSPDRHGIISNEWFDRPTGKYVYCV